jgi:hypothetical protein
MYIIDYNKGYMKIIRIVAVIIFLLITVSCAFFKYLKSVWEFEPIDLNKMRENFEAIPNVRVIKVFYDDVDQDWFGAVIVIDENKLLVLKHLREEHFSENSTMHINIPRIGNYRVSCYVYDPNRDVSNQMWRSDLHFGKDTRFYMFYNKLFNLGEINTIKNIIDNYDLILYGVEQLPDDDYSLSNPHNNVGFWKPHDLESKSNLLHFTFSDGIEYKIGKIKLDEIKDYSLLNENIKYWDLLKFK